MSQTIGFQSKGQAIRSHLQLSGRAHGIELTEICRLSCVRQVENSGRTAGE